MKADLEITDEDLDRRFPEPDEDEDGDSWGVHVMVMSADGTRHGATIQQDEDQDPGRVVEAIVRCAFAAAGLHSPEAAAGMLRWLAKPPDEV